MQEEEILSPFPGAGPSFMYETIIPIFKIIREACVLQPWIGEAVHHVGMIWLAQTGWSCCLLSFSGQLYGVNGGCSRRWIAQLDCRHLGAAEKLVWESL